ncbi:ThiF family adenylyltransferase [Microbacterium sp. SS28]|uniref:ThiF family adenylyltransferase n=1 Tax=Microbacterium sp. SS28 TaxID=2919948 RepID=UPI001FAA8978|nr:ThiF family adenylyltransferase [Microbacterium sp. SS28]
MPLPPLVEPVPALADAERARTARHTRLAGFGEVAQRRLAASRIAVVGAGGLGSPAVLALSAAGVGELIVIDDDAVEHSNLQRQVIHRHVDLGAPKVDSAVRIAAELSPETIVRPIRERLTADNAARLLARAHLVIDGTDTFETRETVAAATESLGIPLVWGTVQGFDAQVTVFWSRPPAGTAPVVLADLYPPGSVGDVPTCADVGVLGALCLQVGALLATEAIKLVTGVGEPLLGRVLVIDGLRARQHEIPLRSAVTDAAPLAEPREAVPSTDEPTRQAPASPRAVPLVGPEALAGAVILDVREQHEVEGGMIPGSRHVPLAVVLADPESLRTDEPIVVVCKVGVRARRAAEALRALGIGASVLAGGLDAWPDTVEHPPTRVPA